MTLDRRLASRHSALWAAYGGRPGLYDRVGGRQRSTLRTGTDKVVKTDGWRRRIGGQFGAVVPLPPGTYSDDTQLRLSVARAIGSGGKFDAEAFAKIELTVWPAYALGAGRASKQAATNLARRDVNWFSNFYSGRERSYWESGGNGAAMRIQPHVWAAKDLKDRGALAVEILRDAICTHGHPRALAGAILHGWWLAHVLAIGEVPGPSDWYDDINRLSSIDEWIDQGRHARNLLAIGMAAAFRYKSTASNAKSSRRAIDRY
jgi:ADP-ribosylglycohydrolase